MPRSPKRSKPYTSLQKQNRHYRQKRAQFVKGLCASAHMNGSEFLIMLASPKGQVETFASEAFRPSVTHWLPESLLREARNIAVAAQEKRFHERTVIDRSDRSDEDDDGEESDKEFLPVNHQHELPGDRLGINEPHSVSLSPPSFHPPVPPLSFDSDDTQRRCGSAPQALNDFSLTPISATSTLFSPSVSSFLGPFGTSGVLGSGYIPSQAPLPQSDDPSYSYHCHGLNDIAYIPVPDKFYETKFAALQQKATKRIAKAWIKVIEPKKQTRFPYNKGEAAKPSWWPRNLRHKEPDHLKSQERAELLIAILRSPLIRVEKLELKTAEEASFLQQDKIPLLREIYRVAREEEKARDPCLALHHRGVTSFHSSATHLKRHNPVDSDTEDFPTRPSNPGDWTRMTAPGVADISQGTDTMHLRGTTRMDQSFPLEHQSPDGKSDHPRTNNAVMPKSPGSTDRETVPGGPFTFQPLPDYCLIHEPKRSGVGVSSQISQVISRSACLSTPYTTLPHAHTVRVIHQAGTSTQRNGYASPLLVSQQPQKHSHIGATTPLYAPMSESTSGSTADFLEDAFQSSSYSPENEVLARPGFTSTSSLPTSIERVSSHAHPPTNLFEAWQGNGNGDTSSAGGAVSLHSFPSDISLPVHLQESPDAHNNTRASIESISPACYQDGKPLSL